MMVTRAALERRVLSALDASPSRIPVMLGGCGSGRTQLLHRLRDRLGRTSCQYLDIERTATTPERFLGAITATTPFRSAPPAQASATRGAFDAALAFLDGARGAGNEPTTFLLDEVLELRTFESFPGLRNVLHELLDRLATSGNRFVLTSRYVARALRLMRDATPRFEVIHMPPLSLDETREFLPLPATPRISPLDLVAQARAVHALADGRPGYVRAVSDELMMMYEREGAGDPVSALSGLLASDGRLASACCFSYELRLHRARGYGALKAILEILAQEESLTLTEIAQRLRRTPGSTKDYLSWLEDVDLVAARQKRYSFTDPLLRLWVRLYCRALPPTEEELAREVQAYAMGRLPHHEPELALASASRPSGERANGDDRKPWGIIEID
jgi:hypothetical protein